MVFGRLGNSSVYRVSLRSCQVLSRVVTMVAVVPSAEDWFHVAGRETGNGDSLEKGFREIMTSITMTKLRISGHNSKCK